MRRETVSVNAIPDFNVVWTEASRAEETEWIILPGAQSWVIPLKKVCFLQADVSIGRKKKISPDPVLMQASGALVIKLPCLSHLSVSLAVILLCICKLCCGEPGCLFYSLLRREKNRAASAPLLPCRWDSTPAFSVHLCMVHWKYCIHFEIIFDCNGATVEMVHSLSGNW